MSLAVAIALVGAAVEYGSPSLALELFIAGVAVAMSVTALLLAMGWREFAAARRAALAARGAVRLTRLERVPRISMATDRLPGADQLLKAASFIVTLKKLGNDVFIHAPSAADFVANGPPAHLEGRQWAVSQMRDSSLHAISVFFRAGAPQPVSGSRDGTAREG